MAPYVPPNTHYAHLNVSLYTEDMIFSFMGKSGHRFYKLTTQLGLRYIWFNKEKMVIEVWGPFESLRDKDPVNFIHRELEQFIKNVYFRDSGPELSTTIKNDAPYYKACMQT